MADQISNYQEPVIGRLAAPVAPSVAPGPRHRRTRGQGAVVAVVVAVAAMATACGPASLDEQSAGTALPGLARPTEAEPRAMAAAGDEAEPGAMAADRGGSESAAAGGDGAEAGAPIEVPVVLPFIPLVAVPDVSVLGSTGDVVADRLGQLVSPTTGVELLTASCGNADDDLLYRGSTGTDVFAIEGDGSGVYVDQSADGLVSLEVDDSGAGEFYDRSGGGLITIKAPGPTPCGPSRPTRWPVLRRWWWPAPWPSASGGPTERGWSIAT